MGDMADDLSIGGMCAPECEHKNKILKCRSNEHSSPVSIRFYMCKDCGEILNFEGFSLLHSVQEAKR